jgi:hypothetical protein
MTNQTIQSPADEKADREFTKTEVNFDDPKIEKSDVSGTSNGLMVIKKEIESLICNPTIRDSALCLFFKNMSNKKDDFLEDVVDKLIFGRIENCLLKSENADQLSSFMEELLITLNDSDIDEVIKGKILKSLGFIQHKESKSYRAYVISEQLKSKSLYVRHASAIGLSSLMDERYIRELESAYKVEKDSRLKKFIEKVIKEIRESLSTKIEIK